MTKKRRKTGISATFVCGKCGKIAAKVTLVLPGQSDPRLTPEPDGAPRGISRVFIKDTRLSVDGGPLTYTTSVNAEEIEKVKAALLDRNAASLYAINDEFAPFWCPNCECSYCRRHFQSWTIYDEGYFDYIKGLCPKGHMRILND